VKIFQKAFSPWGKGPSGIFEKIGSPPPGGNFWWEGEEIPRRE